MAQVTSPHREKPEVSRSGGPTSAAGGVLAENCRNTVFTSHPDHRRPLGRLAAFHFHCVRRRFFARSLKDSVTSTNHRIAPAQCESAATSPSPPAFPVSPSSARGPQNVYPAAAPASEDVVVNVNDLYSRLMLNCGLRVAGAMALTTVPALFLFKRPSVRAFLVGGVGGFVSGWQLYRADLIMRNPRENAALVPKAASLAECADEIQREWTEIAKRFASFSWKNRT